jgi:hypothetical protein
MLIVVAWAEASINSWIKAQLPSALAEVVEVAAHLGRVYAVTSLEAVLGYFWQNTSVYNSEFLFRAFHGAFDAFDDNLLLRFCIHLPVLIVTTKN